MRNIVSYGYTIHAHELHAVNNFVTEKMLFTFDV